LNPTFSLTELPKSPRQLRFRKQEVSEFWVYKVAKKTKPIKPFMGLQRHDGGGGMQKKPRPGDLGGGFNHFLKQSTATPDVH